MALGPSLKINSTKPVALQLSHPQEESAFMLPEYALLPTGNAWISETVPGFNIMRASYRWSALGIFAFWLLVMIWGSHTIKKTRYLGLLALLLLIALNFPNLVTTTRSSEEHTSELKSLLRISYAVFCLKQKTTSTHT